MEVQYSNIPNELKALPQWVRWNWSQKANGDKTKVPMHARKATKASSTDSSTWGTYEEVSTAHRAGSCDGIGFVFTRDAGFIGVDLDDCLVDGLLRHPEAAWVAALNSYTEVSPSGTGVKIIFKGKIPDTVTRRGFGEGNGIYDTGRFFTITGNRFLWNGISEPHIATLYGLLDEWFPPHTVNQGWHEGDERFTDAEVWRLASRATNGQDFKRLFDGHWEGSYPSQSNADAALIMHLSFYTGPCPQQLDRIFRTSGLMRDKWDEMRGAETYGERTINKVLDTREDYYTPNHTTEEVTMPQEASHSVTGYAQRGSEWREKLNGYTALTPEEMPYYLAAVINHVQPLGASFDADAAIFLALANLSSLFGGIRFENLPLNIWSLLIAESGTGKSVLSDELNSIAHEAAALRGQRMLRFTSGTTAGLLRRLADTDGVRCLSYFSEWSGFAKSMLTEHGSGLREAFMDLYDGRNLSHQLATETLTISNPHLVVTGATTKQGWVEAAAAGDTSNGFYSRFLLVASDNSHERFTTRTYQERQRVVESIADHLLTIEDAGIKMAAFDLGADVPYDEYLDFLDAGDETSRITDLDKVPLTGVSTVPRGRLAARTKKVASLLELLEKSPRVRNNILMVREGNVRKAIRIVQRGSGYATRCYSYLAASVDTEIADKVLEVVNKYGNITIGGVMRAAYLTRNDAERALNLLTDEAIIGTIIEDGKRVYKRRG